MSKSRTSSDIGPGGLARRGRVVVVTGPSGVGKTTVCDRLLSSPTVSRVVTATTRPPRPGEKNGEDYHFMDRDAFVEARDRGAFLEWAEVYGRFYGTPRSGVENIVAGGHDALLVIDVQGAAQVKSQVEAEDADGVLDALFVFLEPPDLQVLKNRLEKRATESDEQLATRLEKAEDEMREAAWFDHRVVNRSVDEAASEIERVLAREPGAG